ncbi:hypothetical protein MKX01_018046 [Papaver californicum]|nr:hypothetical protein MKX01_018046 [Papaver californicum]
MMISGFTPCLNYITQNSSGNGSATATPSSECCRSLKSIASSGMNCACLIVTGSIPFQLPINRTLVISLPKACNLDGVPVQCDISTVGSPSQAPESIPTLELPPVDSDSPNTSFTGTRPVVDPSSAAKVFSSTRLERSSTN